MNNEQLDDPPFFVVDAFVVFVVFVVIGSLIRRALRELAMRYPEQTIANEAFRKTFQTVAIGSVHLGLSVHIAADDDYLHWTPAHPGADP